MVNSLYFIIALYINIQLNSRACLCCHTQFLGLYTKQAIILSSNFRRTLVSEKRAYLFILGHTTVMSQINFTNFGLGPVNYCHYNISHMGQFPQDGNWP